MKRYACVFFSLLISLFFISSVTEGRSEAGMFEANWFNGEIVELPGNILDSNTVKCFELLSDGSFLLSEANRFVITDTAGSVLFHGELVHPKLRDETSEIRGVGATEDGLLFAVFDYQSNSSYLAKMHFDERDITYLPLMECCICSATMNGDHMLLAGEKGVEKRLPWASLVALDGAELWQYVDTSFENIKTNITHRVEAGVVNQNVVCLLICQIDKVEKGYSTQYSLQINNLDSGSGSKILLNSSGAINAIQQLEVNGESVWILCTVSDGERNNPTVLCIDLSTGEQVTVPCFGATRVRQLLASREKVILNAEYEDYTIISTWAISGEYIAGVKYPRESEYGRMTVLRMIKAQGRIWAVGVISRYENGERIRTTFLVPVE